MPSFLETKLSGKRSIFQILLTNFGIGLSQAQKICRFFGFKPNLFWHALSNKQRTYLIEFFSKEKKRLIGEELAHSLKERKTFLVSIQNFRGIRIFSGLPVRGQRTKTNKKTAKKLNRQAP